MILQDELIRTEIEDGDIDVEPAITNEQIQPASLDVRMGERLYNVRSDTLLESSESHVIEPNTAYIGHTLDCVSIPDDLAAQLTGRSTFGRKFVLMHVTAGWLDPGFEGEITLEIYNLGNKSVEVDVGDRIAQLVFMQLAGRSDGYDGRYQGQKGITLDK